MQMILICHGESEHTAQHHCRASELSCPDGTWLQGDRAGCKADGLSWEVHHATYGAFDLFASQTSAFAPGAESWLEFVDWVRATLERLARCFAKQPVVALTHAGIIVASVLILFDIPRLGTSTRLDPEYTSLTEWRLALAMWRLVRFNDTAHLPDGDAYDA